MKRTRTISTPIRTTATDVLRHVRGGHDSGLIPQQDEQRSSVLATQASGHDRN